MRKSSKFAAFLIVILAASFFCSFAIADTTTGLFSDGFETDFSKWTDGGTTTWIRDTVQKYAGTYSALCGPTNDGNLITDNIDTSAYLSGDVLGLSFWCRDDDMDNGDGYLYYYDGSTYDQILDVNTITGNNEDTWTYYSVNITDTQYFKSNFRVAFYSFTPDSGENFWVDEFALNGTDRLYSTTVVLTESIVPSDSLNSRKQISKALSASIDVTDSLSTLKLTTINLIADLSAIVETTDALYSRKEIRRVLLETTTPSDSLASLKSINFVLSEVAALTSSMTKVKGVYWTKVETAIAITESLATRKNLYRTFAEAITVLDQVAATKGIGVQIVEVLAESLGVNADLSTMKAIRWVATGTTAVSEVTDITKHILNTFIEFMDTVNVGAVLRVYSPLIPTGPISEELTAEVAVALAIVFAIVFSICFGLVFSRRRRDDDEGDSGVWQVF